MIRLIVFIVIFAVFLAFIVLNLENKCDLSLGFVVLKDIPVFLSSLSSFILGMLITIPLMLFRRKKKQKPLPAPYAPPDKEKTYIEKTEVLTAPEKINKEDSPYGID